MMLSLFLACLAPDSDTGPQFVTVTPGGPARFHTPQEAMAYAEQCYRKARGL